MPMYSAAPILRYRREIGRFEQSQSHKVDSVKVGYKDTVYTDCTRIVYVAASRANTEATSAYRRYRTLPRSIHPRLAAEVQPYKRALDSASNSSSSPGGGRTLPFRAELRDLPAMAMTLSLCRDPSCFEIRGLPLPASSRIFTSLSFLSFLLISVSISISIVLTLISLHPREVVKSLSAVTASKLPLFSMQLEFS